MRRLFVCFAMMCSLALPACAGGLIRDEALDTRPPTEAEAASLFAIAPPMQIIRDDSGVPGWTVSQGGVVVGHIGSTWEIAGSVGYSGRPLDVLVAIGADARIKGALLVRHDEPVLTLGISDADIAAYVSGFAGHDLTTGTAAGQDLPDVISRATVSTGVIRDGILRTARTLAMARGLMAWDGGIDRIRFDQTDWAGLLAKGALTKGRVTMDQAAKALAGAKVPLTPGPGDFLRLWFGVIDPPTIGHNLLDQQDFTRAIGNLPPGGAVLAVMTRGVGGRIAAPVGRPAVSLTG